MSWKYFLQLAENFPVKIKIISDGTNEELDLENEEHRRISIKFAGAVRNKWSQKVDKASAMKKRGPKKQYRWKTLENPETKTFFTSEEEYKAYQNKRNVQKFRARKRARENGAGSEEHQ